MPGIMVEVLPEFDAPSFLEATARAGTAGADGSGFSRLAPHLLEVQQPAQYLGGEPGSVHKEWEAARFRLALGFPDLYRLGMAYHGLQILYHVVNHPEEATPTRAAAAGGPYLCERCFCPDRDMQELMRCRRVELFTLESKRPLRDFDAVGFSFNHELQYPNLLRMLRLAGIPIWQRERGDEHPLIIGGGECMLNPEPVADFLDAVAVGDGEELVLDLAHCLAEVRGAPRSRRLAELSHIPGIYIPSFYEPAYGEERFACLQPRTDLPAGIYVPSRIIRRLLPDFARWRPPLNPVVPWVDTAGGWANLEVMRGCPQRCRFCHAGHVNLPARTRDVDGIVKGALELVGTTGSDQVSLLSLSLLDHPQIVEVLERLRPELDRRLVSLGVPSLRMDAVSRRVAELLRRPRESSLTFAPEAGTQRLRDAINKRVNAEDCVQTFEHCAGAGWQKFKLYFMVGFPGETEEDLEAIVELTRALKRAAKKARGRAPRINVSVNALIPKPHTPLQWAPLVDEDELRRKHSHLRAVLRELGASVRLSYASYEEAFLETLLARGDRRLARVLALAEERGLVLHSVTERVDFAGWRACWEEAGVDAYREVQDDRSYETPLPWDHIDNLVRKRFLWSEWQHYLHGSPTPSCNDECVRCGVGCESLA